VSKKGKGKGKAAQRRKITESPKRRYGFWMLGIVAVIAVVILVIFALQGSGNDSASAPIPSPLDIPRISPGEVKVLLDVAGAISIPLEEVAQRYRELQGYDEVATYCT
jgi:hypothetical protein